MTALTRCLEGEAAAIAAAARRLPADQVDAALALLDACAGKRAKLVITGVGKSGIDGTLLTEAKHINLSLSYLEQVIVALQERAAGVSRSHVPYRNSALTSVLRDSLGGNARTAMVATISPLASAIEEGVSTCRFAQRVAMVTNSVSKNEEVDPQLVIKRLKDQLAELRAEVRDDARRCVRALACGSHGFGARCSYV